jgi:hypothetical protein
MAGSSRQWQAVAGRDIIIPSLPPNVVVKSGISIAELPSTALTSPRFLLKEFGTSPFYLSSCGIHNACVYLGIYIFAASLTPELYIWAAVMLNVGNESWIFRWAKKNPRIFLDKNVLTF